MKKITASYKKKRSRRDSAALRAGYVWIHEGGGTWLPMKGDTPHDDDYRNLLTGEVVHLKTSTEVHFKIVPQKPRLKNLGEITRRKGVNRVES